MRRVVVLPLAALALGASAELAAAADGVAYGGAVYRPAGAPGDPLTSTVSLVRAHFPACDSGEVSWSARG